MNGRHGLQQDEFFAYPSFASMSCWYALCDPYSPSDSGAEGLENKSQTWWAELSCAERRAKGQASTKIRERISKTKPGHVSKVTWLVVNHLSWRVMMGRRTVMAMKGRGSLLYHGYDGIWVIEWADAVFYMKTIRCFGPDSANQYLGWKGPHFMHRLSTVEQPYVDIMGWLALQSVQTMIQSIALGSSAICEVISRNPSDWSWNNCRCEVDRHTSGAGLGDLLGISSRHNPSQPQTLRSQPPLDVIVEPKAT